MSTNSRIAQLQLDGTVKSIYCHFDGYIEHTGKTLLYFYNINEKVDALIALGNLESVEEFINPLSEAPEAYPFYSDRPVMLKANEHTCQHPQKGVTTAYNRDGGEDFNQLISESLEKYEEYISGHTWNYYYIWKGNRWHVKDYNGQWLELNEDIVKKGLPKEKFIPNEEAWNKLDDKDFNQPIPPEGIKL